MILERRSSFGWPATAAGSASPRNGIAVHFDGNDQGLASKSHNACRDYWKSTRRFHMGPSRGWLDIGYSFGCCPHGVIFEGRGLNHQQAAQPGGNSTWYSCTFMSGPGERPPLVQVAAFREFRSWLRGKGVAPALRGHRDFVSTDCPGTVLYRMVRDGTLATAPPKPAPRPAPKPPAAPKFPGRVLRQPPVMVGDDVHTWQRQMRTRGWRLADDRKYGKESAAVCRAFQIEKKLKVRHLGQVDAVTWAAAWTAKVT